MNGIMTSVPALIVIGAVLIPLGVYAVLGVGERMLANLLPRRSRRLRPWLWLAIPLIVVGIILVYPLVLTIVFAFGDASASGWVGFDNFAWSFSGEMLEILSTTALWVVVLPIATIVMALIVGVLFDKVRYERVAMTLIILPTAISFTAGSVVWRQLYSYQPAGTEQLGLLNALWTLIPGTEPVPWLLTPVVNNFSLIFVAIWATLGVAALIISAAVKNVPSELTEAAQIDGASPWRIFYSITLPSILPALLVVLTIEVISALKIFDIVYVMTDGNFGTDTIANQMYKQLFVVDDLGHASAIAVILLIAALPVVFVNIRQFRNESAR